MSKRKESELAQKAINAIEQLHEIDVLMKCIRALSGPETHSEQCELTRLCETLVHRYAMKGSLDMAELMEVRDRYSVLKRWEP